MRLMMTLLATAFLSIGCSSNETGGLRVEYQCGETRFAVEFRGDTAVVTGEDGSFSLPIAISASGARYSDGTSTYWEHQGTALFELPDTSYQECVPDDG